LHGWPSRYLLQDIFSHAISGNGRFARLVEATIATLTFAAIDDPYLEPVPPELELPEAPGLPELPDVPPPDAPEPVEPEVPELDEVPAPPLAPDESVARRSQPASVKLITAATTSTIFVGWNFSFIVVPFNIK
jgi:hypothetical protein